MVSSCCLCGIAYGDKKYVSFHRIPKNEVVKQKWLSVIKKKTTKSSTVCSLHFKANDFNYKVIDDVIKKSLISTAVPSLFTNVRKSCLLHSKNILPDQHICTCYSDSSIVNESSQTYAAKDENIPPDQQIHVYNSDSLSVHESSQTFLVKSEKNIPPDQHVHVCNSDSSSVHEGSHTFLVKSENIPLDQNVHVCNSDFSSIHESSQIFSVKSENLPPDQQHVDKQNSDLSSADESDDSSTLRNKNVPPDQYVHLHNNITNRSKETSIAKAAANEQILKCSSVDRVDYKRRRRIRYIGDLCRDDFTSDRAHEVVQNYYEATKKALKVKDQKISRLSSKTRNLKNY